MRFPKYHGLGNDYFVFRPSELPCDLSPSLIQEICDRHTGAGSDGILLGPYYPGDAGYAAICADAKVSESAGQFALRIFNPDGSEAEKSGNGLRIFTQYLFDCGEISHESVSIITLGGCVSALVQESEKAITVEMGTVTFDSARIPVSGVCGDVVHVPATFGDCDFRMTCASIGNPHCILLPVDSNVDITAELATRIGPAVECDSRFPNKTNVQFLKILGEHDIAIEIWERGAGYTLASGSSSSAAACSAIRLGYCKSPVCVHSPGGELTIEVDGFWQVTLRGPAVKVCDIIWDRFSK